MRTQHRVSVQISPSWDVLATQMIEKIRWRLTMTQEVIGYDIGGKDNVVRARCLLRSVSVR